MLFRQNLLWKTNLIFTLSTAVNNGEFGIFSDVYCHLKHVFINRSKKYFLRVFSILVSRNRDRQIDTFALCSIDCYIVLWNIIGPKSEKKTTF
jgi:hypothetical protein